MYKLDRIDLEILDYLSNHARLTNKDLAKKVGIAPSTCLERVRVLQAARVIKGFHAAIDFEALGFAIRAMIALQLKVHARDQVNAFYNYAVKLTEVTDIYHLSGANDFLIKIAVRNTEELKGFVMDAFASRSEVAHIETSLIYTRLRKYGIPSDIKSLTTE